MEPKHIEEKALEKFASLLGFLIVHVNNDPTNSMQFMVVKKEFEESLHYTPRDTPPTYPYDYIGPLLRHIRNNDPYAELLGQHHSDLRSFISEIMECLPTKSHPTPTWFSVRDTINKIGLFLQETIPGLKQNNQTYLVAKFEKTLKDLIDLYKIAEDCFYEVNP